MKRVLFLLAFLAVLLLVVSCVKPEPPKPPAVFYAANTIVKSGKGSIAPDKLSGITPGSNLDLRFIPESGYSLYSVKINGVLVDDIIPSSTEVTYTIRDIKSNITVEVVFVETGVLMVYAKSTGETPWKWTKLDIYKASDNTFIRTSVLAQSEKEERFYFLYPSKELIVLNLDNSVYFKGTWDLKQDTFYRGSEAMSIWEISKTKIVLAAVPIWGNAENCYIYAVYTYERI